jgi:hypothetical protein
LTCRQIRADRYPWSGGSFPEPEQHERSAFQDELAGVLGSRQAIEQSFTGESHKRELVFNTEPAAVLEKRA